VLGTPGTRERRRLQRERGPVTRERSLQAAGGVYQSGGIACIHILFSFTLHFLAPALCSLLCTACNESGFENSSLVTVTFVTVRLNKVCR